jgi:hypothetical protein
MGEIVNYIKKLKVISTIYNFNIFGHHFSASPTGIEVTDGSAFGSRSELNLLGSSKLVLNLMEVGVKGDVIMGCKCVWARL